MTAPDAKAPCPLCASGTLVPERHLVPSRHRGLEKHLPLRYSVCDACGSAVAGQEESRLNKEDVLAFRLEADDILDGGHDPGPDDDLSAELLVLDLLLTGNDPEGSKARAAARAWPATAREWIEKRVLGTDGLLYLSDGGYSRVLASADALEDGRRDVLRLASESADRVKRAWDDVEARRARATLSRILRRAWREIAAKESP